MNYWSNVLQARVSRRRALVGTAAVSVSAAFLAACGGGNDGQPSASRSDLVTEPADTTKQAVAGGILKDRTFADPPTMDNFTNSRPLGAVAFRSYNALVNFKPGHLGPSENELVGDLAESWETSPDGLTITLKLRQGVKWHNKAPVNGRLLDVEDVRFTWDRFVRVNAASTAVANVRSPNAPVLSVAPTDTRTIVIKLKEPLSYALGLFTSATGSAPAILAKETDTTLDMKGDIIGTGPYMLTDYKPSVSFTFKRHPDYWDKNANLIDQIDLPIITEYASALGQFKAGNIYTMGSYDPRAGVNAEDVLTIKKDEPRISIYEKDLTDAGSVTRLVFGWRPDGKSPWRDERVRQAASLAIDRDLYNDTFFNVSKFEAAGLPVETRWNSALTARFQGWWLDPKGKDFGPNAKFFKHDPAEAKKLLAAAGYPTGFETLSNYTTGTDLGNAPEQAAVMDGMLSEVGIRSQVNALDYLKEYVPRYRDGKGQYEGWSYKSGAGSVDGGSAIGMMGNEYWSKGGINFAGFSANGLNDQSGDPQVDSIIEKARTEQDTEKQRALVFELQRYLAKTWYMLPLAGPATGFEMAWPALANFRTYRGSVSATFTLASTYGWWIDKTKAPF